MQDWLAKNMWALWGALGLILATAELLTLDLTLIMLAVGAFAAAGVSLIVPSMVWLQAVVGIAVAVAMLGFLRPSMLRRFRNGPGYRSQLELVVGSTGTAMSAITRDSGTVKIKGEEWSARLALPDDEIAAGDEVIISAIDGVTAVVHSTHHTLS